MTGDDGEAQRDFACDRAFERQRQHRLVERRHAEIVREAYDASGASALRRSGALQRLLRDASCMTHHISSNLASYELTGRVRCDIDELSFRV